MSVTPKSPHKHEFEDVKSIDEYTLYSVEEILSLVAERAYPGGGIGLSEDEAKSELLSTIKAGLPEKKSTDYMSVPYGVNPGKDCAQALNNGFNDCLKQLEDYLDRMFGGEK